MTKTDSKYVVKMPRADLLDIVNDAIEEAEFPRPEYGEKIRESVNEIDRVAFGSWYEGDGECGCPLVAAGFIDLGGSPTSEEYRDLNGSNGPFDKFIGYYDLHITNSVYDNLPAELDNFNEPVRIANYVEVVDVEELDSNENN